MIVNGSGRGCSGDCPSCQQLGDCGTNVGQVRRGRAPVTARRSAAVLQPRRGPRRLRELTPAEVAAARDRDRVSRDQVARELLAEFNRLRLRRLALEGRIARLEQMLAASLFKTAFRRKIRELQVELDQVLADMAELRERIRELTGSDPRPGDTIGNLQVRPLPIRRSRARRRRRPERAVKLLGQVGPDRRATIPELGPDLAAQLADELLQRRGDSIAPPKDPRSTLFERFLDRLEAVRSGNLAGVVRTPPDLHEFAMIRRRAGRELPVRDMQAIRRLQPFPLSSGMQTPGRRIDFQPDGMVEPLHDSRPYYLAPIGADLGRDEEGGSHLWPS